ncbi:MAG TPA: LysM peptidoglycan-binding domain-containing protein [Caldilineae bacterium]|nr:LysM peptidoglycan-binding domain-containing protein [Caldilineae bacterium]
MMHRFAFSTPFPVPLRIALGLLAAGLVAACARGPAPSANPQVADPTPSGTALLASSPPTPIPTDTSMPTATPTLAPSPTPTDTPTPTPGPTVAPDIAALPAVVRQGDFLGAFAARYGISLDALIAYNHIENPNMVAPGQRFMIPYRVDRVTPEDILLPDSELLYGPAYLDFDAAAFVDAQGGGLSQMQVPFVDGGAISGGELVNYVAIRYSVGPRVLLALIEARSGLVTRPETPDEQTLDYPLGHVRAGRGLLNQLEWAANALNSGFYGWLDRGETAIQFQDYRIARAAPNLNPGTVAIQRTLAQDATFEALPAELDAFMEAYTRLFGDPFQYDAGPILPWELAQPPLAFPWQPGTWWFLTGGPHGAWGSGSGWAALDFVPEDAPVGSCLPATTWATAASPGLVVRNNRGELLVDLDEDGDMRTGWVLQYLHLTDRVAEGERLKMGDPVGRPACDGGTAISSHLHFARRYNGLWVAAGSSRIPLTFEDGWTAYAEETAYRGGLITPDGRRVSACDCRNKSLNGIWLVR